MKSISKAIALCLALLICLTFPIGVSAATTDDATIDFTRTGSITIYKYDLTNSEKDRHLWKPIDRCKIPPGMECKRNNLGTCRILGRWPCIKRCMYCSRVG